MIFSDKSVLCVRSRLLNDSCIVRKVAIDLCLSRSTVLPLYMQKITTQTTYITSLFPITVTGQIPRLKPYKTIDFVPIQQFFPWPRVNFASCTVKKGYHQKSVCSKCFAPKNNKIITSVSPGIT